MWPNFRERDWYLINVWLNQSSISKHSIFTYDVCFFLQDFQGRGVLILRNPYEAILSCHNFMYGGHHGQAPTSNYQKPGEPTHQIIEVTSSWYNVDAFRVVPFPYDAGQQVDWHGQQLDDLLKLRTGKEPTGQLWTIGGVLPQCLNPELWIRKICSLILGHPWGPYLWSFEMSTLPHMIKLTRSLQILTWPSLYIALG